MKVLMIPTLADFGTDESGIKRVVEHYHKYAPEFGIEYVDRDQPFDLMSVHAGMTSRFDFSRPIVSHCHGVYWTSDYLSNTWEFKANYNVVNALRVSTMITVPSEWVAETLRRDMRIDPVVVHHGIDWWEWNHSLSVENYVLWNKNRAGDVCDPQPMVELAKIAKDVKFITTFMTEFAPENVKPIGVIKHGDMKKIIQRAGVYLSSTKETFGIGVLEALAAGTPVLGYAYGGNMIMVKHGVNGYLAKPGDIGDLYHGLKYCFANREVLSKNAKTTARAFGWRESFEKVAQVYDEALKTFRDKQRPHRI